jgi:NCS1 family nucleobase:cation symporter-1
MVATKGQIGLHHLTATADIKSGGWGWFFVWSINSGMGKCSGFEIGLAVTFSD